jgi:hypothetical protein
MQSCRFILSICRDGGFLSGGIIPLSLVFGESYSLTDSLIVDGLMVDYDSVFFSCRYSLSDFNIFAIVLCHLSFIISS